MGVERFLVQPGSRVHLSQWDPNAKDGFPASKDERMQHLGELARQVDALQDLLYAQNRHKVLLVLQGMDTSGKDGTIRHVFAEVDPLGVRAVSFRAPVGEELEHDFLWRVHRQVPRRGEIVIFNRSHYEDVLVTRVHQWIDMDECRRRYEHINGFERALADAGMIILKFFLHISKDEQRDRLQARVDDPSKRWKFNPRDLDERKRWDDYMRAYEDMLSATSAERAPWFIVPANSKSTRNLIVSTILVRTLQGLRMDYPQPAADFSKIRVE